MNIANEQVAGARPAGAAAHPNASTIESLREVADWLEGHPELPACYYASVCVVVRYMTRKPPGKARAQLTALARALGDRAIESKSQDEVKITGRIGSVRVYGTASIDELVDRPPTPVEYEPIIQAQEGEGVRSCVRDVREDDE